MAVWDHSDHLGDSGIPFPDPEAEYVCVGSISTDWLSVCRAVTSSTASVSLTTIRFQLNKNTSTGGNQALTRLPGDKDLVFSSFPPPSRPGWSGAAAAGARSEQYAFRLQAAMGRAVMVGRGPTGAGVLVLSVLIVLTAEGCRGQKGWCHTAAVMTGGDPCDREYANASRFKVLLGGGAFRKCYCPANWNLPYMAVCLCV